MISIKQAIAVAIAGATSILAAPEVYAQGAVSNAEAVAPPAQPPSPAPAPTPSSALAAASSPAPEPSPAPAAAANVAPAGATNGAVSANEAQGTTESEPPAKAKPALPEWMNGVTLGGGVLLWYYQPINVPGAQNDVSVFWARLLVDGKWGPFGVHLEPRFRDTKLRPFFDGPVWLQEAYASVDLGSAAQLRVGKTYSRLGIFWYTSFYGNVQVYDGLKLDPDYGVTLQGDVGKATDTFSLGWWAQYFVVDGSTNVSLPDRDTISYPGARRRNQAIGRVEPRLKLGPVTVALGASGEFLQATDLPGLDTQNVWRLAGDATAVVAGLTVRGEVLHQDGRTVVDFPIAGTPATATAAAIPGQSSAHNDYLLAGAEYTFGPLTAVYTYSLGSYNDVSVKQWMHVPALSFAASPNVSLLAEVVFWQNQAPTGTTLVDRSFNLTVNAHL
jgi:hypothetical protein